MCSAQSKTSSSSWREARAAEQLYAELSRKCDTDLAKKGLKRTDLPRATFIALTKGY